MKKRNGFFIPFLCMWVAAQIMTTASDAQVPPTPIGGPETDRSCSNVLGDNAPSAAEAKERGNQAARTRDFAAAMCWFLFAAGKGDPRAMNNIAALYSDGLGVPKDDGKAVEWLRKGAALGDDYSEYNLGFKYQLGLGVPRDYAEAVRYYNLAADGGNRRGQSFRFCNRDDVKKVMLELTKHCDGDLPAMALDEFTKLVLELKILNQVIYNVVEIVTNNSDDTSSFQCRAFMSRDLDIEPNDKVHNIDNVLAQKLLQLAKKTPRVQNFDIGKLQDGAYSVSISQNDPILRSLGVCTGLSANVAR
jgi:TPR repeat protein